MGRIELNNVSKKFNDKYVLKDITYSFNDSNVYLISGETGVGKSTLVSLIYHKNNYEGSILYDKVTKDDFSFDIKNDLIEELSGIENLSLVTDSIDRIYEICKNLKIYDLLEKKVSTYSNGEYQRLSFARIALIDKPIMILDEPTACLDYENKKIIYDYLYSIKKNRIIIIVSHDCEDDRFIRLQLKDSKLIEHDSNIYNDNLLKNYHYKFRFDIESWFKINLSNLKTNWLKIIILSILTAFITFLSFSSINVKDEREELVNYLHQSSDISTNKFDEANYYEIIMNYNDHYIFNKDDSLDKNKHNNIISNKKVKDYYCNNFFYQNNMFEKIKISNQFFDIKDTQELGFEEVALEIYNVNDVNINDYMGLTLYTNYSIYSNFKFVVKRIELKNDDSFERVIIKPSNQFKKHLEDNYLTLNFQQYHGYIDNSKITKDNLFKYETIRNDFKDEYSKYNVYRYSILCNVFLVLINGLSLYITFCGLFKNMAHSKTILESLGANKFIIYSFFAVFCMINFIMILVGVAIFNANKITFYDTINSLLKVNMDNKFNYIILIEVILSIAISIWLSLKKYSIFKIEKIN